MTGTEPTGTEPWVAKSRADLLAGAESRVVVDRSDGKSGSVFELVTIDGRPHFAKTLGYRTDWIMRVTGDHVHRPYRVWQAGIMGQVPDCIDHAVVAMSLPPAIQRDHMELKQFIEVVVRAQSMRRMGSSAFKVNPARRNAAAA